jgi:hypothetical protein
VKFTSNRDIVVRSKSTGHAIEFKKGVPTQVPPGMHSEVMEKGILPVEDDGKAVDPVKHQAAVEPAKPKLPPEDGDVRNAEILEAIKVIVARNNSKDFAGGGCPHQQAVSSAIGYRVDQKEVRLVWEKHREAILNQGR